MPIGRRVSAAVSCTAVLVLAMCASAMASGRVYVSRFDDGELVVVDVDTRAVLRRIAVGGHPTFVAASPDGRRTYVVVGNDLANHDDDVLAIVDARSYAVLGTVPLRTYPRRISITPDSSRVYVANYGWDITVVDGATGAALEPISLSGFGGGWLMDVEVIPDGSGLLTTSTGLYLKGPSAGALIRGTLTGEQETQVAAVYDPDEIAVTPDGDKAYVSDSRSGGVTAVDVAGGQSLGKVAPVDFRPVNLAVSPDGASLYAARSGADAITVWNTATDAVVGQPIAIPHAGDIGITPDGTVAAVLSGDDGGDVMFLDTATKAIAGAPLTVGTGGAHLAVGPVPPELPIAHPVPAPPGSPPPPPPAVGSGPVVASVTRTIRRTVRLRRGCTAPRLRISGGNVRVTFARRLAGGRCRVTLRVAGTATGRRDLLVQRGGRTVRLHAVIGL